MMPTRTSFSALLFLLFTFVFISAAVAADRIEELGIDLSLGYRADQLDWSIAGDYSGQNPNILSELTWSDLEILQLQLDGFVETKDLLWLETKTLFLGTLAYGSIYSGNNQDSDYAGDNRTLEWSRSNNQADDGFTFDVSGAFGPKYELVPEKIFLTPLIGYSVHIQDLSIKDGQQTVSDDVIHDAYFNPAEDPWPVGAIPGLDSSYRAYWYGPWLGLNLQLTPVEKWSFEFSGEYHIVELFAEADWNLRSNLAHPVSFEHEAHGTGLVFALKSCYELSQQWALIFSGNVQSWQTGDGVDTTYYANGSRGGTRVNEVNWSSYALMLGLRYGF